MAKPEVGKRYRVYAWGPGGLPGAPSARQTLLGTFAVIEVRGDRAIASHPERWDCLVNATSPVTRRNPVRYTICPDDLELEDETETTVRRFENTSSGHYKFWEIDCPTSISTLTVRWGKIGTSGTVGRKAYASMARRDKEAEAVIRRKLASGYREILSVTSKPKKKLSKKEHSKVITRLLGNNNSLI